MQLCKNIRWFGLTLMIMSFNVCGESVQNIKTDVDTQVIKQEIMADLVREKTQSEQVQVNPEQANVTTPNGLAPSINNTTPVVTQANVAPVVTNQKSNQGIGMMDYAKVIISLSGILALFILVVGLIRKASKKISKSSNLQMEILSRMPIAPKRELILARVGDETILVGSSEAGLNFMTTIDSVGLSLIHI